MREAKRGFSVNCFNHNGLPAVAVCVVCGKGTCKACVHPAASGDCVCSEACEQRLPLLPGRSRKPATTSDLVKNLLLWGVIFVALMLVFQSLSRHH